MILIPIDLFRLILSFYLLYKEEYERIDKRKGDFYLFIIVSPHSFLFTYLLLASTHIIQLHYLRLYISNTPVYLYGIVSVWLVERLHYFLIPQVLVDTAVCEYHCNRFAHFVSFYLLL